MKRLKTTKVRLLLISIIILSTASTQAQVYVYPIQPGTDKWKSLKSRTDMLKATELPYQYLNASSAELLQSCLSYPLLFDFLAYDNPYYGFNEVVSQSNALSEFRSRDDSGSTLLNYYKNIDIQSINLLPSKREQGYGAFMLNVVEFMLSDSIALNGLSKSQQDELITLTQVVINSKENSSHIFGINGIVSSLFLLSKTLNMSDNTDWKEFFNRNEHMEAFMSQYAINEELLSNLKTFAKQLKK